MVRVVCTYNPEWYENTFKLAILEAQNSRNNIRRVPEGRLTISNEVQQNLK